MLICIKSIHKTWYFKGALQVYGALFAVMLGYMQKDDMKQYAVNFYETDNIAGFTILLDLYDP